MFKDITRLQFAGVGECVAEKPPCHRDSTFNGLRQVGFLPLVGVR